MRRRRARHLLAGRRVGLQPEPVHERLTPAEPYHAPKHPGHTMVWFGMNRTEPYHGLTGAKPWSGLERLAPRRATQPAGVPSHGMVWTMGWRSGRPAERGPHPWPGNAELVSTESIRVRPSPSESFRQSESRRPGQGARAKAQVARVRRATRINDSDQWLGASVTRINDSDQ